jgi:uncharacterized protein YkwD
MNLIDILLIVVIGFSTWQGINKGFLIASIELITWLGSLILCFLAYPYVSGFLREFLHLSGLWILPISFICTMVLIRLFFMLVIDRVLNLVPERYYTSSLNKWTGFLPGLVNGWVYALIITASLLLLPFGADIKMANQESLLSKKITKQLEKIQSGITPLLTDLGRNSIANLTVEPGTDKFIKLGFTVNEAIRRPDLEVAMLVLINKERAKEHLRPLKADPEVAKVALLHSKDMFARGYFSHFTPEEKDPFDRMRALHVQFLTAGENLALAQTLSLAHDGLMKSPGHRANILHKSFVRFGIGILDGGIHGLMITQNFRN